MRRPSGLPYSRTVTRIYAWLQKHPFFMDGVLTAVLVLAGFTSMPGDFFKGLVYICISVPVLFRRTRPVTATLVVAFFAVIQVAFGYKPSLSDCAVPVVVYSLAAYRPRRYSLSALSFSMVGTLAALLRWTWSSLQNPVDARHWQGYRLPVLASLVYAFTVSPMVLAWILGDSMQYRRAYYLGLEDKANRLERERDQQSQIAAAAERARIARELHDVVAHNVSVMVVQAEGASYALESSPDQARQALGNIAQTGRTALAEMRRLLGVLRTEDVGAERAPQPGVGQLEDLLEQVRAAGLPVTFTVEGIPVELPQGVALAAYRIVQESLTNTRKHGGPQVTAQVALSYLEDELRMTVSDDGRGSQALTDGMGNGLIGMRERAALYCGVLTAGPLPGGGFEVEAVLPYKEGGEA
jgi:signal transduction histidine kinase